MEGLDIILLNVRAETDRSGGYAVAATERRAVLEGRLEGPRRRCGEGVHLAGRKYRCIKAEETIKKLLKKVEAEEDDRESNLEEFERKLHQVMKRYKLDNTALASEIINLHKDLTK